MVACAGDPTTLKFRFINVPEPASGGFAPGTSAERIRWPELLVSAETCIPLLKVPAISNAGVAGVITAGLNETCRSYETIPNPVVSPALIGIEIVDPGKAATLGSEIVTNGYTGVAVAVAVSVGGGVPVEVAVTVGVGVVVFVGVLVVVGVAVAVGVNGSMVTLPFVVETDGLPSLNKKL